MFHPFLKTAAMTQCMMMKREKLFSNYHSNTAKHKFRGDAFGSVSVTVEKNDNDYIFHRIKRNTDTEKKSAQTLIKLGLPLKGFRTAVEKAHAFSWLNENRVNLLNLGFEVSQPENRDKKYFVGKAVIELEMKENIDWFDIHAKIRFGEYENFIQELRKLILKKKVEFKLPEWGDRYYSGVLAP